MKTIASIEPYRWRREIFYVSPGDLKYIDLYEIVFINHNYIQIQLDRL